MNSGKAVLVMCIASFIAGSLFTSRTIWTHSSSSSQLNSKGYNPSYFANKLKTDCDKKRVSFLAFVFYYFSVYFKFLTYLSLFFTDLLETSRRETWRRDGGGEENPSSY